MLDAAHGSQLHATPQDTGPAGISAPTPSGRNPAAAWCVAHTHPQAEAWAHTNLRRAGYETYLPLYRARRRDRVVRSLFHNVLLPLFPRYVFLVIADGTPWVPARYAPGVHALLMADDKPQYVAAGAVEAVREAMDGFGTHPTAQTASWRPGAVVRVARGIFDGMPGVVLSADGDTARVGVMFLGQLRQVALPAEYLTARDADL